MSEAAARTAIYNAVNGVTNIGLVYDYERFAADWGAFLDLFRTTIGTTPQIRGWEVAYRGFTHGEPLDFSGQHIRAHRFNVMGYMGVDDANSSEKTFAALAEDVADALDADGTLHSSTYYFVSDASIQIFEPRSFAGVLAHYAELQVTVEEVIT